MRKTLAALALLSILVPGAVAAQPRASSRSRRHGSHGGSTSLRAQLGIPVALRLLESRSFTDTVRGVERLGAIGTPEAIDALVDALGGSGGPLHDARVRLTAVRVLANETKRDGVRQLLVREVTDLSQSSTSPIAALLRGTAAMALARGGDRKAVGALVSTLLRPGPAADAATLALRVHPPESLDVFSDAKHVPKHVEKSKRGKAPPPEPEPAPEGRKRLSAPVATFLGEIGDMRAIDRLRPMLAEGEVSGRIGAAESEVPGKIAAAQALAKLGDEAALPLAREWLGRPEPRLRLAAANVLIALDAPEAPAAVVALIESDAGRNAGLRLAWEAPSQAYAAPIAKLLPTLPVHVRPRAIATIGRARGANELAALLDKPDTRTDAAFALATMPGDEAKEAIAQAIGGALGKKAETKRLLVRAATVRALALGDPPAGLGGALRDLSRSKDPADRAAGTFGRVALGDLSLGDAIEAACKKAPKDAAPSCDPAIVGAAARGALARADGPRSLAPLFELLRKRVVGERPDAITIAAGAALLAHPDGADLPTLLLASWAEGGGPLAPLAARALPSRDDEALRGRIKRLLEGSDPVVRAHVALGLARDPEPSAASLLTDAYRVEEDARVRRAIVRALSKRAEPQRHATLVLARDLDPDDGVRGLARAALGGRDLEPRIRPASGVEPRRSVAWVTVRSNDAGDAPRALRLVRSDGLAVPLVADPDGIVLAPGLPPGPMSVDLDRP
jgi:cellulose synthase operon protein C